MKCPSCGSENETGAFCTQCGAALNAPCPGCGAQADPGARFCSACGEPLAARRRGSRAPWYIAAIAVLVTILILLLPDTTERAGPSLMTGDDGAGLPAGAGGVPGAGGVGSGMLSNDMRTNADRLFNRIMAAAERGDDAEVNQFMPMAIQAYGMVDDLDNDGLYHLAILHLTAGQYEQATATADSVLERHADHILMLGVAAEAAAAAGDSTLARALYQRLLDAYDDQAARPIAEYVDHNTMLAQYRTDARAFLDG